MMNLVIHASEPLIFRDGRPFGDPGNVYGGMLRWPMPSTIAGMIRYRIGISRDTKFFSRADEDKYRTNVEIIQGITTERVVPLWKQARAGSSWQYIFPCPADALVIEEQGAEGQLRIHSFRFVDPAEGGGGVDLPWKNWRIPVTDVKEKPASERPGLWTWENFLAWLRGDEFTDSMSSQELGLPLPAPEVRLHTALQPGSRTAATGQLFSSQGVRLETGLRHGGKEGWYGIGVSVSGYDSGDKPIGPCMLGGERKTAHIELLETPFPECPDCFEGAAFLRLILITPGDFGGWVPNWLMPLQNEDETPWVKVPGTDYEIRLVSAFMPRWQPVSGWDYLERCPKATRKLVPPGAVYVIEMRDPSCSLQIAEHLWGRSICQDPRNPDGYGCVCVGIANLN